MLHGIGCFLPIIVVPCCCTLYLVGVPCCSGSSNICRAFITKNEVFFLRPSQELARLFNTKIDGMHIKYKILGSWENVWPINGSFDVPGSVDFALLIALDHLQDEMPGPSSSQAHVTPTYHPLFRRGNNAVGSRAIPSCSKRKESSVPLPLKKRKVESCFKTICVSEIDDSGNPISVSEVPIDLT